MQTKDKADGIILSTPPENKMGISVALAIERFPNAVLNSSMKLDVKDSISCQSTS